MRHDSLKYRLVWRVSLFIALLVSSCSAYTFEGTLFFSKEQRSTMLNDQHKKKHVASLANETETRADDSEKPLLVFNGIWKNKSGSGYWINGKDAAFFMPTGEIVSLRGISGFSRLEVLVAGDRRVVIGVGECLYPGARATRCSQ
jgi:hypothetical protein